MYSRPVVLRHALQPLATKYTQRTAVFRRHYVTHPRVDSALLRVERLLCGSGRQLPCRSACTSGDGGEGKHAADTPPSSSSSSSSLPRSTRVKVAAATTAAASTSQAGEGKPVVAKELLLEKSKNTLSSKLRRMPLDLTVSSMERNFITPGRAMSDFLLKMEHLENLKAIKRRSAFVDGNPITVYWRKDVEAKALEVWGSKDNLLKEILRRQLERKYQEQSTAVLKRQLKSSRREGLYDRDTTKLDGDPAISGLWGSSGRVVLSAVAINFCNFVVKAVAWVFTGSHSMFAETIHSLADTANQLILAYGIHKSIQKPNPDHPYGYANMKYVSSLISGVGIFCVGTGLSVYHGVVGLLSPAAFDSFYWAFLCLAGSLMSEGATCLVAISSIRKGALASDMSMKDYILSGQDPSVNVVLLEDCAALLSVLVTASCIGLTVLTNSHIPDAIGSLLVGGILGGVASFIIYTNVTALVGKSIPQTFLDKINYELESDVMVRGIHDVKGIEMGNTLIRYKAEIDFDGRELTRLYLDHQDLQSMFDQVRQMKSIDEFESFLLGHCENIIDTLGGEIDRIEVKLRKKFPQIRHCDLEVL